jgi:hypothetical protein
VAAIVVTAGAAPWGVVGVVVAARPRPPAAIDPGACTRACHDRGCRHRPALPPILTGDDGLYGATIRALRRAGEHSGLGRRRGYGAANLALFCVLWPGAMLLGVGVAAWQRLAIRDLRREARRG